jgi:hypothetical protein
MYEELEEHDYRPINPPPARTWRDYWRDPAPREDQRLCS